MVWAATSIANGGVPARGSGKARASSGATTVTSSMWWNTRAENNADDSAQSGDTKTMNISASALQPARASDDLPRATATDNAMSAASSSGSVFQRVQRSEGTGAGPQ